MSKRPPFCIPHLRWMIALLLLVASIINAVDRSIFSILAPTIQSDLRLTDHDYGNIVSLFLVAYAIGYVVTGPIGDKIGTRCGLGLFIAFWSVANLLTGLARSAAMLGTCRFFLGIGEAGGPTTSPKIVSEWFPPRERAIAIGMYSVAGAIGATISPIIAIGIAARYGWQTVFVVTGIIGVVFALIWLLVYRTPSNHRLLGEKERAIINEGREVEDPAIGKISGGRAWKIILASPVVWTLMLGRLLTDPVWFFYNFWFAKYLHTDRGFTQAELGSTWVIFLAADAGFVLSGFLSAWFIRRGTDAPTSRRRVLALCAFLVPLAALVPLMPGRGSVFAVSMVVLFAEAAWLTSITAYMVDLIPRQILGTAIGLIGMGSSFGGIAMSQAVPWAIAHVSYSPCFYAMVIVHPLAIFLLNRFTRTPLQLPAGPALA